MPGMLAKNARCPECGEALIALCDLTNGQTGDVTREYFHEKRPSQARRAKCTRLFTNFDLAWQERRRLEMRPC